MWFDGVDNDGNGLVDDSNEQFTGAQPFPNWSTYIEDNQILVFDGRKNKYNAPEYFEDDGTDGISALGSTEEEWYNDINGNNIFDWNDCNDDLTIFGMIVGIDGIWAQEKEMNGMIVEWITYVQMMASSRWRR